MKKNFRKHIALIFLFFVTNIFFIISFNVYFSQNKKSTTELKYDKLVECITVGSNIQLRNEIEKDKTIRALINSDVIFFEGVETTRPHPLEYAIKMKNIEKIKVILEYRKSDIDSIVCCGRSLSMQAIDTGNVDVIDILLNKGMNVDYCDRLNGFTCLMYAVYEGKENIVLYLLRRGVNVNAQSIDVNPECDAVFSALDIANWRNNKVLYKLLLSYGAVNYYNKISPNLR